MHPLAATTRTPTTPADFGFFARGGLSSRSGGHHLEATTMRERWKPFAAGNYEASNLGRVRRKTPGRRTWPGRMMSPQLMKIGYLRICPVIDGKNVPMYVHKIVAELFIGPCQSGNEINHKDGDKANNDVRNLEYVTHQENMRHARRNRMIKDRCTVPVSTVRRIKRLRRGGMSYANIAKQTGVSLTHCYDIATNKKRKDITS